MCLCVPDFLDFFCVFSIFWRKTKTTTLLAVRTLIYISRILHWSKWQTGISTSTWYALQNGRPTSLTESNKQVLVQPTTTNQPWPLDLLYHRYMTLNLTLDLKTVLLQTSSKKSSGNVKIAHLNIRLLKCCEHRVLVKEGVLENKFDIFTISETWLNNSGTEWK